MSLRRKLLAHFVFILLGGNLCMLAVAQEADLVAQCRLEAEGYAIPPEQIEEYVEGCMLSRGGTLSSAPEQSAGIEAQCRQEAKDYGIAPEQQTEYINGCILSLGGQLPSQSEGETQDEADMMASEVPEAAPPHTDADLSQEGMPGELQ